MAEFQLDLSIGETIQVGNFFVTLLDIHEGELSIEVEGDGEQQVFQLRPQELDCLTAR